MDQDKQLQDSIRDSEHDIASQEAKAKKAHRKKRSNARPLVAGLLILVTASLLLYKFALVDPTREDISNDFLNGTVELVMEADAGVYSYHSRTGELPESLPDVIMRSFVSYEKIDTDTYSLTPINEIYNNPVVVNRNQTISTQQILDAITPEG